jgi:hypothetical protein
MIALESTGFSRQPKCAVGHRYRSVLSMGIAGDENHRRRASLRDQLCMHFNTGQARHRVTSEIRHCVCEAAPEAKSA